MEGDEDGDGVLTTKEFKNYILRNVVDDESLLSGADLDHLLKLLDLDSDGIIDPEEFMLLMQYSGKFMKALNEQNKAKN